MAVKTTVAAKATKSKAKKKTTKAKSKGTGLQLTAAQWKQYQKAYTAAYQNQRLNNAARAVRARRLQAANKAVQAYSTARHQAQAAAVASFAVSQTAAQAGNAQQNSALRARVNANLRVHLSVLSKAQYEQASKRSYMQSAVQKTQTIAASRSYEEKAFKASTRISRISYKPAASAIASANRANAQQASQNQANRKASPAIKTSTSAARGRTSVHQTSVHQSGKANRATRAGQRSQASVTKSAARAHQSAAKSVKAPVATYKARTAPKRATDKDVKELLGIDPWESTILDPGPRPIRFDWLGDETTPDCVVTAVANSCLLMTGIILDEEELKRLRDVSLMYMHLPRYPLGIRILSTLIAARRGGFSSRVRLENAWPALMSEPLTPGMVIGYDTPNGPHAALLLPGHRVATWGGEEPLTAPIDEAWVLKWTT